MTLGGLALAIGMLVDNAIVVLENINRLREAGQSPEEAAVNGSDEVTAAIVASTLTTLAVFLPPVLSVTEASLLALEHNRGLSVQRLGPPIQRSREEQERAVFDPLLSADLSTDAQRSQRVNRSSTAQGPCRPAPARRRCPPSRLNRPGARPGWANSFPPAPTSVSSWRASGARPRTRRWTCTRRGWG